MKALINALIIAAGFISLSTSAGHHNEMSDHKTATKQDIVDVAVSNGSFNTLVEAVKAAGLVDTLKSSGPFTVFAPTDAAFAALPAGTLDALLADREKLASILTYHVVPGKVSASEVVNLTQAKTVQGQNVNIEVKYGKVYIDEAEVVMTDVAAANGVIHVIDKVILPEV